jgi:hypothetical protein
MSQGFELEAAPFAVSDRVAHVETAELDGVAQRCVAIRSLAWGSLEAQEQALTARARP